MPEPLLEEEVPALLFELLPELLEEEVVVAAPAGLAAVVVAAVAVSAACSLTPLSVPQLLLYHVETCAFCVASVQAESHIPTAELYSCVR